MSSFQTIGKISNNSNKRKKILNIMEPPVGDDDFLHCSYYGCNTKYKNQNLNQNANVGNNNFLVAPMNEDDKFWAILESINQTKLFCMHHVLQHATTICANSKIIYED
jgi:hypothetical protein